MARLLSESGGGESVVEMILGLLEPEPLTHISGTCQILRQMTTRTQSSSLWLSAIQRVSCPFRIERYLDSDGMCTLENHGVRAGAPAFEYIQPDCAAKNSSKLSAPLVGGKETGHKTHELIQPSEIKCSHCTLSVGSLKQFVCRSCPSTKSRVRATNEELLAATFAFCSQGIANPLAAVLKTNSQGSFRAECQDCNGLFCADCEEDGELFSCDDCKGISCHECGGRHDVGSFCMSCDDPGYGIVLDSLQLQFCIDQFDPFATTFRLPLPIGQGTTGYIANPFSSHHQFIGLVWVTGDERSSGRAY